MRPRRRPGRPVPPELLTSVRLQGWHAIYPSATRTLCGLDGEEALRKRGRRVKPTCVTCIRVALELDAIVSSTPLHWELREANMADRFRAA